MEKLILNNTTTPLENLVHHLHRLPGIGPKMAERLAFYILKMPLTEVQALSQALLHARSNIGVCSVCFGLSESETCAICSNLRRDPNLLCVVEKVSDINSLERTNSFYGLYHVLGGLLSPLDGIGPENLYITQLIERVKQAKFNEIIIATNPSVEGEATATYLVQELKPLGIRITRIAFGLPIGGDIEHADELTLAKALEGRREIFI